MSGRPLPNTRTTPAITTTTEVFLYKWFNLVEEIQDGNINFMRMMFKIGIPSGDGRIKVNTAHSNEHQILKT